MSHWKGEAAQIFFVFVLAVASRILSIDQSAGSLQWDEYYHLLAAQGWLHEGSFRIAQGNYPRASLFTWLVAQSIAVAPNNILLARLPAIIAGSLLVASVFVWTRRFGNCAAWTATLLLCFDFTSLASSHLVRFYSLHALAFWIGSIALYEVVYGERPRRVTSACVAVAALALALHLQITTLIGIAALGAWSGMAWTVAAPKHQWLHRAAAMSVLPAAILLIVWLLRDVPMIAEMWATYRSSAQVVAGARNNWLFYYQTFAYVFGILLYLLPVAAMIAVRRTPRPALFCLTIVIVTLALHSGAGSKELRLIPYVLPFFFILWGLAAAPLVAAIRAYARKTASQLGAPRLAEAALTWAAIGIALTSSESYIQTVRAVGGVVSGAERNTGNLSFAWETAAPELRRLATGVSVFVVVTDVHALYFIGGYDLMLNRTVRDDYAPNREFATDPRTGGAAIATAASMRLVIDCYPSGLVVVPRFAWRNPSFVTNDVADSIATLATRVPLRSTEFLSYQWRRDTPLESAGCAAVYRLAGEPGHVPFTVRR